MHFDVPCLKVFVLHVVKAHTVTSKLFSRVTRDLGLVQNRAQFFPAFEFRDSDARGDLKGTFAADEAAARYRHAQRVSEVRCITLRKNDAKLVASEAGADSVFWRKPLNQQPDLPQQSISGWIAARVVDEFELIDVDF